MSPDRLSVLLRTLAFACLFQAAGAAFFLALFGSWLARTEPSVRRLGWYAALAGVPLLAAHRWLEGARMAGDYVGLLDPALQWLGWSGSGGNAALIEIIGLAVIAAGLARPGRAAVSMASTGAVIATCAFALTGHSSEHAQRALLAPLLCLHLLLVSFWFGALMPLILCSRREARTDAVAVLRSFSGVAGWLVPCIGVAGLLMAITLIPAPAGWRATYGLLLLGKLAAFGLLLLLAAWVRWRAVPAMVAGDMPGVPTAPRVLSRAITIEYLVMLAVFATTAVLTSFYSPRP